MSDIERDDEAAAGGQPPSEPPAGAPPAVPPSGEGGGIGSISIEEEMKRSYLDYAMSVIVARALPDVRDGLKPVHRRILHTMKESGYDWNRPFRKSARIVGDVMGKYHPHGDTAIYDAMVRMAQDFSMRLPLIEGQGNFGSIDNDPPAAMRYTEARLDRVASDAILEDIDKDTVDFQPNYDESAQEPTVLPARLPNLLVNGAGGIAVGMATNIPPHNLGEVIDACFAYLDDPEIGLAELMELVPAPDFPTGGIILGRAGVNAAYHTGRGSIVLRSKTHVEEIRKDREAIVVTEIPYQVSKARMIERIAEVVRDKTIEGISDLRDESDRHGLRVVIELRRDAMAEVVLNQLYRYTPLQTSFGANMVAINGGRPQVLTLREMIGAFLDFREEVIGRRTAFELGKARERAHVLVGLAIAVANIDEVIALIRAAPDPATAREELMARSWQGESVRPLIELIDEPGHRIADDGSYRLSEAQARAILDLRLQRLTGLERERIAEELEEIAGKIRYYLEILASREKLLTVLRDELQEVKDRFSTPRRTAIEENEFEHDIEDLIPREDMVVTVSHGGYVKRVPLSTYRAQRRGGKGRSGMATREEDFVSRVLVCDTHTPVLFFSSRGMAYVMKVYRLPLGTPQARGKAFVNLLPLGEGESITTFLPLPEDTNAWEQMFIMFATSAGTVRRNRLSDFTNVKANGKIAMKLEEGAQLVGAQVCGHDDDVLLTSADGKAIRFPVDDVRVFAGRDSQGVRGIKLAKGDRVISMSILHQIEVDTDEREAYFLRDRDEDQLSAEALALKRSLSEARVNELAEAEEFILSVSSDGFGKRTSAYEYRVAGRGGQGVATMELGRAGGVSARVVAAFPVGDNDQLMLITQGGQLIRTPTHDVRIAGRSTRGVTLFRVGQDDRIVSVAHLEDENGEEENGDEEIADGGPLNGSNGTSDSSPESNEEEAG